jgi:hypothetical protein
MSDKELARRITFAKIPPLEELIFARMPRYYPIVVPESWTGERKYYLNQLGALAEELRLIWKDKKVLPLPQRCVEPKVQVLRMMEKRYGVSDKYVKERHILYSSEVEDKPWFKFIYEEKLWPFNNSSYQEVSNVNVSRISTASEEYNLISVRFKTCGHEPSSNTEYLYLAAIVTQEEYSDLLRLLGQPEFKRIDSSTFLKRVKMEP